MLTSIRALQFHECCWQMQSSGSEITLLFMPLWLPEIRIALSYSYPTDLMELMQMQAHLDALHVVLLEFHNLNILE